jgi:hypothetical protein
MTEKPRQPSGLNSAGRRLWRKIAADYTMRADEWLILEKACRTADDAERLDTELAQSPLMVPGSQGQMRANPLLNESRQTRALLAALLKQINLPDADDKAGRVRSPRTQRAMTAARARWGSHGA